VRPIYVSMADMARAQLDADGDLRLDGVALSVVYSRYDFSHPLGRLGADFGEIDAALWDEWKAIERMEMSNAVISSTLGCRLAHRRNVQLALVQPGGLERFLGSSEASAVRQVLPQPQVPLGTPAGVAEARSLLLGTREMDHGGAMASRAVAGEVAEVAGSEVAGGVVEGGEANVVGVEGGEVARWRRGRCFVAKNLLRPRTGSGTTQDRKASGGVIVNGQGEVLKLLDDETRRGAYILYPRVTARTHDASVVHNGGVHHLMRGCRSEGAGSDGGGGSEDGPGGGRAGGGREGDGGAISEVASFGAFLTDASGAVLTNVHAGFGVRTRPASPNHPLAGALGYGALGCLQASHEPADERDEGQYGCSP